MNTFIHFARLQSLRHPLESPTGQIPDYTTPSNGEFGATKGTFPNEEHHPAIDIHLVGDLENVNMYACSDGIAHTYKNGLLYRD